MSAGKSESTLVPDWAFTHLRPEHRAAFEVLFVLCYHRNGETGLTYPAARTIASILRVSRQHIMEQVAYLREIGVIVPAGNVNRAVAYRVIDSCPVNSALTGSCRLCPDKTRARSVNSEPAKCQDGAARSVNPLSTKNDRNGTGTDKNGTTPENVGVDPPSSIADESQAVTLERLASYGVRRSVARKLIAQFPDLTTEWADNFDADMYPDVVNPAGFIVDSIRHGEKPVANDDPEGTCPSCGQVRSICWPGPAGPYTLCYDCSQRAIRNASKPAPLGLPIVTMTFCDTCQRECIGQKRGLQWRCYDCGTERALSNVAC